MKVRFISVRFGSVPWNGGVMTEVEKRGKSRKKVEPAVVRSQKHYGGQARDAGCVFWTEGNEVAKKNLGSSGFE